MEEISDHSIGRRLLIADFFFLAGDIIILFLMFKLWFWLFSNRVILIILSLSTIHAFCLQMIKRWKQIKYDWQLYKTK